MIRGLAIASLYTATFWALYPPAVAIAWLWGRWDRVTARRHERFFGPDHGIWS